MFYIIEQGNRIKTPLDALLGSGELPPVAGSVAVQRVSAVTRHLPTHLAEGVKDYIEQQAGQSKSARARIMYAGQLMSQPVHTGQITQTLSEVWTLFSQHRFHHLPLLDNKQRLQGIVSDRDILRFAANTNNSRDPGTTRIAEIMTHPVISAAADTPIRIIAEVMTTRNIGAIPITDDKAVVVGMLSRSDILRSLVQDAPIELWT